MRHSPTDGEGPRGFIQWVKQPNSWLSVIAAIISLSTFYIVELRKGDVQVIMPDKVGVRLSQSGDYAILLIPLTFTNTGAPRSVNHVTHVTATLRNMDPHEISDNEVEFLWRYEATTVDKFEYFQKHPERRKEWHDVGTMSDIVVYAARTFPFALNGGTSASKLFDFVQRDGGKFQQSLRSFELIVHAMTPSETVSTSKAVRYICEDDKLEADFGYCHQAYR
jgi:hypothetical protein